MARKRKDVLTAEDQAALTKAVEDHFQREQDLLLFGCYITVEGKRVDPLTVTWESVKQPNGVGVSLVDAVKAAQSDRARYDSRT